MGFKSGDYPMTYLHRLRKILDAEEMKELELTTIHYNRNFVPGLGVIVTAEEVEVCDFIENPTDFPRTYGLNMKNGLKALLEEKADFSKMTLRNTAYARQMISKEDRFHSFGNWTPEQTFYNVRGFENPVLYLGREPFGQIRGKLVTKVKDEKKKLTHGEILPMDITAFQLPCHENFSVSTSDLMNVELERLNDWNYFYWLKPELQIAVLLLRDQTKDYAMNVLQKEEISALDFWVLNKEETYETDSNGRPLHNGRHRFMSRPTWFFSTDMGSVIDLTSDNHWQRGIRGIA